MTFVLSVGRIMCPYAFYFCNGKEKEQMNILLDRGPDVDDEFWETLEETLILADLGASAADEIVEELRDQARRKAAPDA